MLQERLRDARVRLDLSARELSEAAGLSPGYVALIESGAKSNISVKTATRLATALGVPLQWLIAGEPPPTSSPDLTTDTDESKQSDPAA
jgi:transcriptional regulator with XRE-family HTH domain